jgi:uncharacterized membrane protein
MQLRELLKIWINVMVVGIVLFFAGIFYIVSTGGGFGLDSLDKMTIVIIGILLMIIAVFLRKMKKVNSIKQAYEELGNTEKDSND